MRRAEMTGMIKKKLVFFCLHGPWANLMIVSLWQRNHQECYGFQIRQLWITCCTKLQSKWKRHGFWGEKTEQSKVADLDWVSQKHRKVKIIVTRERALNVMLALPFNNDLCAAMLLWKSALLTVPIHNQCQQRDTFPLVSPHWRVRGWTHDSSKANKYCKQHSQRDLLVWLIINKHLSDPPSLSLSICPFLACFKYCTHNICVADWENLSNAEIF